MSVITVQLGQCGNQIGGSMFSLMAKDAFHPALYTPAESSENVMYKQETIEKYFTEQDNGSVEAKAVLVDMEPKVIHKCQQLAKRSGLWTYSDTSKYIEKKGSANNWALGYYGNGPKTSNHVLELCRKEAEKCDHFGGFLVLMSLAGGTGSGLGTYITHCLHDTFPEAIIANHIVWPYSSGEVIVQNYNTILTLSHLQNSSDVIIGQQNDRLHEICMKLLAMKNVSFEDINYVIAYKLASVLQPAYNNYEKINPLYDLVQAVACHPTYKLVSIKNIPHISKHSMEYSTYVWPALLKHLRQMLIADAAMDEGVNWEVKLPNPSCTGNPADMRVKRDTTLQKHSYNKSLSNLLILRGKDLHHADTGIFETNQLYSGRIPSSYSYSQWTNSRSFNLYEKSAALVSNSQTFIRPIDNSIEKAWKMFNAHAYIHQYEKYGLTENDFVDSFGAVEQVVADYKSI